MANGVNPEPGFWGRFRRVFIHLFAGVTPEEYAQGVRPRIIVA